jgi:magnesium chelatase family protein
LSPAALPKEGSHYDLAIARGLLAAIGVVDAEALAQYLVVCDFGLDGRLAPVPGIVLAARGELRAEPCIDAAGGCAEPACRAEHPKDARVAARRVQAARDGAPARPQLDRPAAVRRWLARDCVERDGVGHRGRA